MTQEQIEQALAQATWAQLTDALEKYHNVRCINMYCAEDVQMFVEEATDEQALAWLEQNENELIEQWGEVFRSYIRQYGDEVLTINTEGAES